MQMKTEVVPQKSVLMAIDSKLEKLGIGKGENLTREDTMKATPPPHFLLRGLCARQKPPGVTSERR